MEEFSEVESQRRFNTQRLWPMENSAFFSLTMKFDGHDWKTKFLVRSALSLYLQQQQQQQQPPPWFTGLFPVTSVDLPNQPPQKPQSLPPKVPKLDATGQPLRPPRRSGDVHWAATCRCRWFVYLVENPKIGVGYPKDGWFIVEKPFQNGWFGGTMIFWKHPYLVFVFFVSFVGGNVY